MTRKTGVWLCVLAAPLALAVRTAAQPQSVVEAAQQGHVEAVRALLKAGAEVNATQGDGMTALHWAAQQGHVELAVVLANAGANLRATTRVGGYTPLLIASKLGDAAMVEALLASGADPNLANTNGTTPLMLAAESGSAAAVKALVARGADVNAGETIRGQTALMFAAAHGRADAVRVLIEVGANPNVMVRAIDISPFLQEELATRQRAATRRRAGSPVSYSDSPTAPADAAGGDKDYVDPKPGLERKYTFTELVGGWGGLAPLHVAARQGELETVKAFLDAHADINIRSEGNRTTPILIATLNGRFDVAKYLLDRGADPNLAQDNGVTPLYAVLNVQWSLKSFYPHPRAYEQQKITYLELMTALIDKGADVNARTTRKVWTTGYDSDRSGSDDGGATPFWRASYASDVAAMKLLVARGADPNIPSMRPYGRTNVDDGTDGSKLVEDLRRPPIPVGGPGVPPLLATSGLGYADGYASNAHRFAPTGMLPAVKYLVEELHADVNATDFESNTAMHNAAARGDNEMILYLISKGANPHAVNRYGQTTVDMANGPVQRTQPYPETIKLLEGLGVKNNHRCLSC